MSDIDYVDCSPDDQIFRGECYRLGFSRGNILMAFITTAQVFKSLWETKIAATGYAHPVSPAPEAAGDAWSLSGGTDVAVIDVKIDASAPSESIAEFASAMNNADMFAKLERIQWIDESQSLAVGVAPAQREAVRQIVDTKRKVTDPISKAVADVGSVLKWALIGGVAIGAGVAAFIYLPRRKSGGTQ